MNRTETCSHFEVRKLRWMIAGLSVIPIALWHAPAPRAQEPQAKSQRPAPKPQTRPSGQRIKVDPAMITVEDGDGVIIRWNDHDTEIVRILGIDTPEIRRLEHNLPYDQPFGQAAKAFAQGAFATATEVEILRAAMLDPYDRSLAYLFVNGKNYSVLAIKARYSDETVSIYGDNGLPNDAAMITAASKQASAIPVAFEPPGQYRARMRALTAALKQSGQYPSQ
jgi:micrococcal nuclease